MFEKLRSFFRPQDNFDPFDFCLEVPEVYDTISRKHKVDDVDFYILQNLPRALGALISDDRFTQGQLELVRKLILSFKKHTKKLDELLERARLKFKIKNDLETNNGEYHKYEGELSFKLDLDETPIWQWNNVDILASYKPMILGVDVLNSCPCVTKVSDNLLTKKKSEDFITPDMFNFAKIKGNDILITDKHLYIKSDRAYDKVTHDALITKHIDSKGFVISTRELRGRVLIFQIHDPNFMQMILKQY